MSSITNTIVSLIGVGIVLSAYQQLNESKVRENFGMVPPKSARAVRVVSTGAGPYKNDFMQVPSNYQAMLSPHAGAGMVDYSAAILYRMPENSKLGTPAMNAPSTSAANQARGYANMISLKNPVESAQIREGFCGCEGMNGGCGAAGCSGGSCSKENFMSGVAVPSASPSYASAFNQLPGVVVTNSLPVPDVGGPVLDALGQDLQPQIIYDRFIYSNQKRRNLEGADFIRGDLPIVPNNTGWFQVSVDPQLDLRSGAMAVLGGVDNSTGRELMALQSAASGGLLDVGGGVNYSVQKSSFASMNDAGVRVTAFP